MMTMRFSLLNPVLLCRCHRADLNLEVVYKIATLNPKRYLYSKQSLDVQLDIYLATYESNNSVTARFTSVEESESTYENEMLSRCFVACKTGLFEHKLTLPDLGMDLLVPMQLYSNLNEVV